MFLKENTSESTKKSKKSKKMEKAVKCPLCCEDLEADDLNFFPCPCGYRICLFCWNRIRTDNDPKCPLCRRTYSENPAKFEPLSAEQLQKLKNKKKQEDVKKKQKLAEDRKQLADVRVVRKNLIFVNELPLNFSKDPKLYQRFLQIFKQAGNVKKASILNSSKNYAGQKAPFARAYVTYQKNEDALRALKLFDNMDFEGRELKLSLGTTKYCSNYIKNVNCTNKECVYLHEQADSEASFTKEQIHAGKHIEYGQRLYEQYMCNMNAKILANALSLEDKKSDTHSQYLEETENSFCASTSLQCNQQNHNERCSSPSDSEKMFKQLQDMMKAANLTESSVSTISSRDPCEARCDMLQKLITMNTNSSTDFNNSASGDPLYKDRFCVKRENGDHEEQFSVKKESLLSRLNLINSQTENNFRCTENFRSSFSKGSCSYLCSDMNGSTPLSLESKDDCALDFDPIQTALGGLGELVISEKQKTRIEVNSLNNTPINAFKRQPVSTPQSSSTFKSSNNQPVQQRVQQSGFPVNNFIPLQSTAYQPSVVDYYNQTSFRPSVQTPPTVPRASVHSQRSQPFVNTGLTIQLPPGMVNGYSSPQQYISQISPQEAFLLSQQQNQSFENFSQPQFSNFEQIPPMGIASMNLGQQRIRNDAIGRQQPYQQQQFQQLQRLNTYSTPPSESLMRPKGNHTFP